MKISFDLDGCLLHVKYVQDLFATLQQANWLAHPNKPFNIICLTSRSSKAPLQQHVADELNIDLASIVYTEGANKVDFIEKLQIDLHFDDDEVEVDLINQKWQGKALLVNYNTEKYLIGISGPFE